MTGEQLTSAGALLVEGGARFTLRSRHACGVELCLFETTHAVNERRHVSRHETRRVELQRVSEDQFEKMVPGVDAGQLYGYRVHGPWDPRQGHRFDSRKLLVDPCARAVSGDLQLLDHSFGLQENWNPFGDQPPGGDTGSRIPLSMVVDDDFDWQDIVAPAASGTSLRGLALGCIYELHVRGMTMQHPAVPPELRGTYLGLVHPAVIEHLKSLGVTAVELLPVAHRASELHLQRRGLSNYWGYSPLAFCAPDQRFATRPSHQAREFKIMVRELHRAGIAVLLDVVLNHTVEGDAGGPTVSLRGIDNASYYRHDAQGRLVDFTGCGNTLDFSNPLVVDLALHSLRVWAQEYRVDGFRFDLAPVLGRGASGARFDPEHSFFERLYEDPVLGSKYLIAEPWDLGPDGYSLGRFPSGWGEWNDRFRSSMRALWRGDGVASQELLARFAGSPDLLPETAGSTGPRSIDYVISHDGFTLEDLVSYEHKHNLGNAEDNRDGSDHNQSRNWGAEGPSEDPEILERRQRAKKGLLTMLALSAGVPMLSSGDELARTQDGNNNAYCQDNTTSWLHWDHDERAHDLLQFVRDLFALRRRKSALMGADRRVDIVYPANSDSWQEPLQCAVLRFRGFAESPCGDMLLAFNAHSRSASVDLPEPALGGFWQCTLSTVGGCPQGAIVRSAQSWELEPIAVLVLEPL